MDRFATGLQEKIQKLINQYTEAKAKLEEAELQVLELTEENVQLISQIDSGNNQQAGLAQENQSLKQRVEELEHQLADMKDAMDGFQDIASDAISKIDSMFPDEEQE